MLGLAPHFRFAFLRQQASGLGCCASPVPAQAKAEALFFYLLRLRCFHPGVLMLLVLQGPKQLKATAANSRGAGGHWRLFETWALTVSSTLT